MQGHFFKESLLNEDALCHWATGGVSGSPCYEVRGRALAFQGLRFRALGFTGFRVLDLRVEGFRHFWGLGFRIWGLGV